MNGARNTQPPQSARLARGDGGGLCCVMTFIKPAICIVLSLFLSFVPLNAHVDPSLSNVCIQKSEAQAVPVAIPAAGAAISALAIELGISESALIAGICAVGVGATGLAFYNASRTDVALPGWRPWDDLTPQEKQDWVGQDGDSNDYYNQQIAWWALQTGMLEQTPNGGLQPTEEPDPENDPNGHEKWQKARNILIALAAGGGAVAFNEAVGPMIDNVAGSIHELLFGSSGNALIGDLGLTYQSSTTIDGLEVAFATHPGISDIRASYPTGLRTNLKSTDWVIAGNSGLSSSEFVIEASRLSGSDTYQTPSINVIKNSSPARWKLGSNGKTFDFIQWNATYSYWYTANFATYNTGLIPNSSNGDTRTNYLNAAYGGTYVFDDGTQYVGGKIIGNAVLTADYGQMSDAPSGLVQNILNQTEYNNWVNNYTNDTPSDYKRALTVPANFNDPDYEPSYEDFVKVTPEQDITVVPDDEPLSPDTPPTPDTQYQEDFGQAVGELLAQPFNQLFPFCLIGDLYALTQKIEAAIYPDDSLSTQDVVIVNGTSQLVVPLDDFGVEGMDDIVLDLTPVLQFGNLVRPWTTAIFIVFLLVGTFRFFLNRGGE